MTEPQPAEEVVVKAYGLIPFKRRTYVAVQAVVLTLTCLLIAGAALVPWPIKVLVWAVPGLFALVLVAEVVETAVMLAKFREKERELRARPAPDTQPPAERRD